MRSRCTAGSERHKTIGTINSLFLLKRETGMSLDGQTPRRTNLVFQNVDPFLSDPMNSTRIAPRSRLTSTQMRSDRWGGVPNWSDTFHTVKSGMGDANDIVRHFFRVSESKETSETTRRVQREENQHDKHDQKCTAQRAKCSRQSIWRLLCTCCCKTTHDETTRMKTTGNQITYQKPCVIYRQSNNIPKIMWELQAIK